jgi:hypothetical protein
MVQYTLTLWLEIPTLKKDYPEDIARLKQLRKNEWNTILKSRIAVNS